MWRPPLSQTIQRAAHWRCPNCGRGRLFRGVFRMLPRCPECGLSYFPEQGYYVGAMIINYVVTTAVRRDDFPVVAVDSGFHHALDQSKILLWMGFADLPCRWLLVPGTPTASGSASISGSSRRQAGRSWHGEIPSRPAPTCAAMPASAPPSTSHAELTRKRSSKNSAGDGQRDRQPVHNRRAPQLIADRRHQRERRDVHSVQKRARRRRPPQERNERSADGHQNKCGQKNSYGRNQRADAARATGSRETSPS